MMIWKKKGKIWRLKHFLVLDFAVTVCVSISALASLIDISKRILSSRIGLKFAQ